MAEIQTRTLWIGDLDPLWDERHVKAMFNPEEVVSIKVIRDKTTFDSQCYGFVEFVNKEVAHHVIVNYHNQPIPDTSRCYRLNWATQASNAPVARPHNGPEFHVFAGNLVSVVDDRLLCEVFVAAGYKSFLSTKIISDPIEGSRGFGFVRFSDREESLKAIVEMNGFNLLGRPIRMNQACKRTESGGTLYGSYDRYIEESGPDKMDLRTGQHGRPDVGDIISTDPHNDPFNTTIFVGNISEETTEKHLADLYIMYGDITNIKLIEKKNCAFIEFSQKEAARSAIKETHNMRLPSGALLRVAWGTKRSPVLLAGANVKDCNPTAAQARAAAVLYGPQGIAQSYLTGPLLAQYYQQQQSGQANFVDGRPIQPSGDQQLQLQQMQQMQQAILQQQQQQGGGTSQMLVAPTTDGSHYVPGPLGYNPNAAAAPAAVPPPLEHDFSKPIDYDEINACYSEGIFDRFAKESYYRLERRDMTADGPRLTV